MGPTPLSLLPLWQKKGAINFLLATCRGIICFYALNYPINHVWKWASDSFSSGFILSCCLQVADCHLGPWWELGVNQGDPSPPRGTAELHAAQLPVRNGTRYGGGSASQVAHLHAADQYELMVIWREQNQSRGKKVCTCSWKIFKVTAVQKRGFCAQDVLP